MDITPNTGVVVFPSDGVYDSYYVVNDAKALHFVEFYVDKCGAKATHFVEF
jgi:hypothetical protein